MALALTLFYLQLLRVAAPYRGCRYRCRRARRAAAAGGSPPARRCTRSAPAASPPTARGSGCHLSTHTDQLKWKAPLVNSCLEAVTCTYITVVYELMNAFLHISSITGRSCSNWRTPQPKAGMIPFSSHALTNAALMFNNRAKAKLQTFFFCKNGNASKCVCDKCLSALILGAITYGLWTRYTSITDLISFKIYIALFMT